MPVRASFTKINSGTYTGDGAVSQAILIGFKPKAGLINPRETGAVDPVNPWHFKCEGSSGAVHVTRNRAVDETKVDRFISFDDGGFTVGDGGSDADPNKSSEVYEYIMWG